MRHFIFPEKDTFITNKRGYEYKNFGIDQILFLGTSTKLVSATSQTTTYNYVNENVSGLTFYNFTGTISGSLVGTSLSSSLLSITISSSNIYFISENFNGGVTGSLIQYYPSGSVVTSSFEGQLTNFSGSISASYVSGSSAGNITILGACSIYALSGSLNNASGSISGLISGSEIRNEQSQHLSYKKEIQRILMKFDFSEIFNDITSSTIPTFPEFNLALKTSREENLPLSYKIYVYPVSQSWEMGDGETITGGSDAGTDWYYRDYKLGTFWHDLWDDYQTPPTRDYLNNYSYAESESFSKGGGTWHPTVCTQSMGYGSSDVYVNVTNIVKQWYSGSIPNEGFIIIHSQEIDQSDTYGQVRYFSRDTNTIYYPYIDVMWDDSTFTTSSIKYTHTGSIPILLEPINFSNPVTVTIKNIKKDYKFGDMPRINVFARESYPVRNFERNLQHSSFIIPKYLPKTTYYSIKDVETDSIVVNDNEYTKLSCDSLGNYFILNTTGLPQERYYKILIHAEQSGSIYTFDNCVPFKIIR
jgi:hypothetical protein